MSKENANAWKVQVGIHLCAWLYVVVTPLIFKGPADHYNWVRYLQGCTHTLIGIGIFYLNYIYLVDRYVTTHRWAKYVGYNVLLIILAVGLHELLVQEIFLPMQPHPRWHMKPLHQWIIILFLIRTLVAYIFMAIMAMALRITLIWHSSEMDRQKAELQNLKSQINPHFLLNTLNNIYALTTFDTQKAQEAIQQLSRMLRYMLYEDSAKPVKLTREIEFVQQYIDLMKLRMGNNVDVRFDLQLPPNCQHEVMPHIFISAVENAFKHGVSATQPSFIHVSCVHDEHGVIRFSVKNSNFPKPKADKSPGGIGLQQVERRLELSYRERYTWTHGVSADGTTYSSMIELRKD